METVVSTADNQGAWTIACDDSCPVVRFLAHLVTKADSRKTFRIVGRDDSAEHSRELICELNSTPWSLLLIDSDGERYQGPEAIPFILKNLPSGRLAAVAYTLPGTMWITRQLYMCVSHNRRKFAKSISSPIKARA